MIKNIIEKIHFKKIMHVNECLYFLKGNLPPDFETDHRNLSFLSENTMDSWGRSVSIAFHSESNMPVASLDCLLPN